VFVTGMILSGTAAVILTASAGATAASVGATAASAATAGGAATAKAAVTAAEVAITITGIATGVATSACAAAALLKKYGLKPRALNETNILTPETPAQRMVSKEVLRVKHAPDMNFMETVRHFTFLLSKKNLKFVNKRKLKDHEVLKREIEEFSTKIQEALATYNPTSLQFNDGSTSLDNTASIATKMLQESKLLPKKGAKGDADPINKSDRNKVINKAGRCLAWAHDPEREAVPGAENMTNEQAAAIMMYTQETCLYKRLNAALRKHDTRALEPFLPYMKLLLSALYQLPLTHVRTYRGVKCELYETYNKLVDHVWSWWSFSSTTKDKDVLLDSSLFLGREGKRTLFSVNAVGVDIAPFSTMPGEEEILLLPGLPLVNRPGENPEPDLWTFDIETPIASNVSMNGDLPTATIDYVHPDWDAVLHDESWRHFEEPNPPIDDSPYV